MQVMATTVYASTVLLEMMLVIYASPCVSSTSWTQENGTSDRSVAQRPQPVCYNFYRTYTKWYCNRAASRGKRCQLINCREFTCHEMSFLKTEREITSYASMLGMNVVVRKLPKGTKISSQTWKTQGQAARVSGCNGNSLNCLNSLQVCYGPGLWFRGWELAEIPSGCANEIFYQPVIIPDCCNSTCSSGVGECDEEIRNIPYLVYTGSGPDTKIVEIPTPVCCVCKNVDP